LAIERELAKIEAAKKKKSEWCY